MKKTLFITDSHIQPGTENEKAFFRFLDLLSETDHDIIFLGDIFDLWVAIPGYETATNLKFIEWCRREKQKRKVIFLQGNHEFYVKFRWKNVFTKYVCKEETVCDGKLLIMHGDLLNARDFGYHILRAGLRNPLTWLIAYIFASTIGPAVAGMIRDSLRNKNMRHKRYFPEQELMRLSEKIRDSGIEAILLGHLHRAAEAGLAIVLPPWTAPDWPMAEYSPETGLKRTTVKEVFKEKWNIFSD